MAVRPIGVERVFAEHRGLLHAVAYRVLGSVTCLGGDLNALMEVLAPDVVLVSDGGGFTGAPRKPIRGIVYVARAIVVLSRRRPAGSDARLLHVNGGTPVLAFTLHLAGGAINELPTSSATITRGARPTCCVCPGPGSARWDAAGRGRPRAAGRVRRAGAGHRGGGRPGAVFHRDGSSGAHSGPGRCLL